jgi:hypothetical protein
MLKETITDSSEGG